MKYFQWSCSEILHAYEGYHSIVFGCSKNQQLLFMTCSLPYGRKLSHTLEFNPTQCTVVHFTVFWVLKSKNWRILMKTHLKLNRIPSKNLFRKLEPWGSIRVDTVVSYIPTLVYILLNVTKFWVGKKIETLQSFSVMFFWA